MSENLARKELGKEKFIATIKRKALEEGYGFVPLMGSGISHGSGIMIGGALGEYLSYVIWRCVNGYEDGGSDGRDGGALVNRGWPDRPTQQQTQTVREWATRWYCDLVDQHGIHVGMARGVTLSDINVSAQTRYHLPPVKPLAFDESTFKDYKWNNPRESRMAVERLNEIDRAIRELHMQQFELGLKDVFTPRQGVSRSSRYYIVETAVRSLYDWRLALQFLARLRHVDGLLLLVPECDQFVIDSFNIFITRGCKPCLAHQMISFLVRPLRMRKLLTTNFDTLLEDAFRDITLPLQVFPIELNSRLPNPDSVALCTSLIKLHGSLHETRADYSLDHSPDDCDKEAFLRYLWPMGKGHPVGLPNHLLVMGTSIPDKRNVELIKYVCDRVPEFRVFVIAHDRNTIESIDRAFGPEYRKQMLFTESNSLDLMLYEIYQVLTYSLPPAGFKFEFSQYVPPFEDETPSLCEKMVVYRKNELLASDEKGIGEQHKFHDAQDFQNALLDQVRRAMSPDDQKKSSVVILDGVRGITRFGAGLFYALKKIDRKECIWFELEDFYDPSRILSELFRSISHRLGLYTIENVSLDFPISMQKFRPADGVARASKRNKPEKIEWQQCDGWDAGLSQRIATLIHHFGVDPANWCIFFYGRNVAGSCASYDVTHVPWSKSQMDWGEIHFKVFARIMSALAAKGFGVIYLPFSEHKSSDYDKLEFNALVNNMFGSEELKPLLAAWDVGALQDTGFLDMEADFVKLELLSKHGYGLCKAIDQVWLQFIRGKPDPEEIDRRKRLVFAATLFRQSRHISALLSEAVFKSRYRYERFIPQEAGIESPLNFADEVIGWVQRLYSAELDFFNRKPGGFAWMYRDMRLLTNALLELEDKSIASGQNLKALRTRIHFWIGEWYLRAFHSSNHIDPLKEAIFHKLMCVHSVKYAQVENSLEANVNGAIDGRRKKSESGSETLEYRKALLSSSLAAVAKILAVSRESLRYWIPGHQGAGIFYWPAISEALHAPPDSVLENASDKNAISRLRKYVEDLLQAEHESSRRNVGDDYVERVVDLLRLVRRECVKLQRDVQRNDPDNGSDDWCDAESGMSADLGVVRTKKVIEFVDFNVPIIFRPGEGWDSVGRSEAGRGEFATLMLNDIAALCAEYRENGGDNLILKIKHVKQQCMTRMSGDSGDLYGFLQLAAEYVFWLIRQVKFDSRCLCLKKLSILSDDKSPEEKEKILQGWANAEYAGNRRDGEIKRDQLKIVNGWGLVGVVSQMLLELLHSLDSTFLFREQQLKIQLLTFSGLALGRLQKYPDAHQVLNEATGVAYRLSFSDSKREMVILRLRRAEVHLIQAISEGVKLFQQLQIKSVERCVTAGDEPIEDSIKHYRMHIAKLDDVWTALDEVESLLINCMHSGFWCGKLYYLRLMVYSEHFVPEPDDGAFLYRPKAFHELENVGENLLRNFERGMLCCGENVYRRLCFLNLFAKACKKFTKFLDRLPGGMKVQQPREFKLEAIRRLYKVLTGEFESVNLLEKPKWDDLLPKPKDDGPQRPVNVFRMGIVANFERVFGDLWKQSSDVTIAGGVDSH